VNCMTVRAGAPCPFMVKNGCSFNGGRCRPIMEKCQGCAHVLNYEGASYCSSYPDPSAKWAVGTCNFATHLVKEVPSAAPKVVDPLKASKRKARGQ